MYMFLIFILKVVITVLCTEWLSGTFGWTTHTHTKSNLVFVK